MTAGTWGYAVGQLTGATRVSEFVEGITRVSEEQAQGVEQVNTAVSQMDRVTQQNASGASEASTLAGHVSTQANGVKMAVSSLAALARGAGQHHAEEHPARIPEAGSAAEGRSAG